MISFSVLASGDQVLLRPGLTRVEADAQGQVGGDPKEYTEKNK
jgi:hypothetical protein